MSRTASDRLADMLRAIHRAQRADARLARAAATHDLDGVDIAFDAILHNVFVIGEAAKALPPALRAAHPEVPWAGIIGMRDVIGHQYHRVVPEIIHATVARDLTPLAEAIRHLQREPDPGAP